MTNPTSPREDKKVKGWAVCFALNRKCMTGEFCAFNRKKNAKEYIKELHKKIGGFEDDHHIVPCEITLLQPKKNLP